MNKKVDTTDRKILGLLMENARISYAEIGRRVHLSRVAVRDRIKQMEDSGVITQYSAIIDRNALGLELAVFLEIEVLPSRIESVATEISKMKEVTIVYQMTGPTILHVHIFIENSEKLSKFLNDKIYPLEGITRTSVYMLLKNYKTNLSIK